MEIVRFKGNSGCRLTVAKHRFTIKFPEGLTPEQEAWIIEFAKRANAKMLPALEVTMRGGFFPYRKNGLCSHVRFRSHGKKKNYTYLSVTVEELGLEPLPMELTERQKKRNAEDAE